MSADNTRLRIVAGKGGVGRTTVTAALAARAAADGKRVLAVDAIGSGGLDQLIKRSADGLPRFESRRLTTRASLDEYLKTYLRLPLNPSRLGPLATIFDYVSAAAPGVRELLIIGKICSDVRNGDWDEIIVDAPATGHVVELLTAPRSMAELIPTGPLAQQTEWLSEILAAESTELVVVAIPEELPVTETGELLQRIENETQTAVGMVIANRTPPAIGADGRAEVATLQTGRSPLGPVAQLATFRAAAAEEQLNRLAGYGHAVVQVADRPGDPVKAVIDALDAADQSSTPAAASASDRQSRG